MAINIRHNFSWLSRLNSHTVLAANKLPPRMADWLRNDWTRLSSGLMRPSPAALRQCRRVVLAGLISLCDEGSLIRRKTFSPAEQEERRGVSTNLLYVSAVNPSQYSNDKEMVRFKNGMVRTTMVMLDEEGSLWMRRREGETRFAVSNCKLLIALSNGSTLVAALSSPVLES